MSSTVPSTLETLQCSFCPKNDWTKEKDVATLSLGYQIDNMRKQMHENVKSIRHNTMNFDLFEQKGPKYILKFVIDFSNQIISSLLRKPFLSFEWAEGN